MTSKEIFDALAAPFPADQVRSRPGKFGKSLSYITARTARLRLNDVLGPENWGCVVTPSDRWVKCSLTICLNRGDSTECTITREALGGYPDMPSEEDKVKGGDSDAFKRACALFGIGEYLYGDEAGHDDGHTRKADYASAPETTYRPKKEEVGGWFDRNKEREEAKEPRAPREPREARSQSSSGWPRSGAAFYAWMMGIKERYGWPSLRKEIDENFVENPAHKFPPQYKEWDGRMVETAAYWVASQCAATSDYKGEFDDHLGVVKSNG